ncbi:MAG: potassium/proton antiporter [Lachnospiraceae bacterium]|nr:potassium/proton antiporter [Lachnospiraceae bacterium]
MSSFILLMAIIILICLLLTKLSSKIGVPVLLAFILLGMLFGSDGIVKIHFDNYGLAEQICSVALIFIMFYGGFGTSLKTAKPIIVKSLLLSSLGVVLTAVVTGLFCYTALGIGFWESMLIGSVISSTDAASVFSILRSKRMNLKDNTAPMLELESGSNDPCSYMLTVIVLSAMSGESIGWRLIYLVFAQIMLGVLFGIVTALISAWALRKMKHANNGIDTVFVFSIALISYAGASVIGGNGYLSAYLAGILLGNTPFQNKKRMVHFFDGVTTLMQMLIFFILGLLSFPSQLGNIALPALAIAFFLTFVARPLSIFAILTQFRCSMQQKLLVSWTGVRGAASIVFAIMATVHPAYLKYDVFHIVLFIVLFSISVQGSLIPFVAKKLNMTDDDSNIMKTFSDYSEEMPIQFVRISISKDHPWANRMVKEITLIPELLLALIIRGTKRIIPKGNTKILEGDIMVLSAFSLENEQEGSLNEVLIDIDHEWIGKSLAEIKLGQEKLVVAIRRDGKVIVPNGKTVIKGKDVLVISQL